MKFSVTIFNLNFPLIHILTADSLSFICNSEFSRMFWHLQFTFLWSKKSTCQKSMFRCGKLWFYKLKRSSVIKYFWGDDKTISENAQENLAAKIISQKSHVWYYKLFTEQHTGWKHFSSLLQKTLDYTVLTHVLPLPHGAAGTRFRWDGM